MRCNNLTRIPWEPVETHVRSLYPPSEQLTVAQIAQEVSPFGRPIDQAQIHRWRKSGVTWDQADRLATELGMAPWLLWGQVWEDVANDAADVSCTAEGCRRVVKALGLCKMHYEQERRQKVTQ